MRLEMNIAAIRRRAARWASHDAAVPYRDERPRGRAHVGVAIADLTGRPVRQDGAYRGRRVSWQEFAELTGRPVPEGARLRAAKPRAAPQPRQEDVYWLGRLARFPERYTDPARDNRGNPRRPAAQAAGRPMAALLRPLSAKDTARTAIAHMAAPVPPARPAPMRMPLVEEHTQGRISPRHAAGAEWFLASLTGEAAELVGGARRSEPQSNDEYGGGGMVPMWSRDPLAPWPTEIAWEQHHRLRKRFRTLGMLTHILLRALAGAEMRDLAPAWPLPQRHRAEAGRIRLRAALELCARMQDRKTDTIPHREVLQIVQAACADCERLVATRRIRALRPANDNTQIRKAA